MERLATGEGVGARARVVWVYRRKLGKGDGETGEDREYESLKNQKKCGAFVVAEGEEEGDRGWSDWRLATGDWRLGGRDGDGCVGLSQGEGDGETGGRR